MYCSIPYLYIHSLVTHYIYCTYSQLNKRIETAQKLVESLENDGGIRIAAEGDKKYWLYNKHEKGHNSDPSLLYTKVYPKSDEYDWLEDDHNDKRNDSDPAPSYTMDNSKNSNAYSSSSSDIYNAQDDGLVDSDDDCEHTLKRSSTTNRHQPLEESPTKRPRLIKKQSSSPGTTSAHLPSSYDKQPPLSSSSSSSSSSAAAHNRRVTFADHSLEPNDSLKSVKQSHIAAVKASSSVEEPYQFALDGTDLAGRQTMQADSDDNSSSSNTDMAASDQMYTGTTSTAIHHKHSTPTATTTSSITALTETKSYNANHSSTTADLTTTEPATDVREETEAEAEGDDVDWESDDGGVVSQSNLYCTTTYSSNTTTQHIMPVFDVHLTDSDALNDMPMSKPLIYTSNIANDTASRIVSHYSSTAAPTLTPAIAPTVSPPQINTISADVAERAVTMASGMADWAGRAVQKALKQHMSHANKGSAPFDSTTSTITGTVALTHTSNVRTTEILPASSTDTLDMHHPIPTSASLTTTTADKDHILATNTSQSTPQLTTSSPTTSPPSALVPIPSSQSPPSPTITMRQEVETLLQSTSHMSSSQLQQILEEEKFLEKISRNRRSINMRDAEVMIGSVCFVIAFVINIHI